MGTDLRAPDWSNQLQKMENVFKDRTSAEISSEGQLEKGSSSVPVPYLQQKRKHHDVVKYAAPPKMLKTAHGTNSLVISHNSSSPPPRLTPQHILGLHIHQKESARGQQALSSQSVLISSYRPLLPTTTSNPHYSLRVVEKPDSSKSQRLRGSRSTMMSVFQQNQDSVRSTRRRSGALTASSQVTHKELQACPTASFPEMDLGPLFHIGMSASELEEMSRGLGLNGEVKNESLLGEQVPPPEPPKPPTMQLTEDQLHPLVPSVFIENWKEANSASLQEFCLDQEIAVVRGLPDALGLHLGIFDAQTLLEADPEHPVEVREQRLQSPDENLDGFGRPTWNYYSMKGQPTTLVTHAKYQSSTYRDYLVKETPRKRKKEIKFGTNIDLSDEDKWEAQLTELQKLPPFLCVSSPGNMLSYVGHPILGMNTVQLYMKIPGNRTPGHQENLNFCSANINIGPDDCEWFAVPNAYWGAMQKFCEQNHIDYLADSWWPDLNDCKKAGIPVYRFTQRPGDLVWVNCGCVHWVQAIGVCNNVAWNLGPLTARQYQMAIERYEWNKSQGFRSIVPMTHLSWNLARSLFIPEQNRKFFELIKMTLLRSLTQCFKVLEFVQANGIEVELYHREEDDPSQFCYKCKIEVFNLLFIHAKTRSKANVYCIECARKVHSHLKGFKCLEEYKMQDLMSTYDSFIIRAPAPKPPTSTRSCQASSSTAPPPTPVATSHLYQNNVATSSSSSMLTNADALTSFLLQLFGLQNKDCGGGLI